MTTLRRILAPLASLRLTVALFVLSMILIFAGTLAQREQGNWDVVSEYFRSLWVFIPLRHLFFTNMPGVLPFPGGFTLLTLLLINLLAAHTVRFKLAWKRAGILIIHAGLILLLVGELVTGLFAHEAIMSIDEGNYANFTEDIRTTELAVVALAPGSEDEQYRHVVVSERVLRDGVGGAPIHDEQLPFDITVDRWLPNSRLLGPAMVSSDAAPPNPANAGLGQRILAQPIPEVTGVEEQRVDMPSIYVTLSRDGEDMGTYLLSLNFGREPQIVEVDGQTYELSLRFARQYQPFTMHLIDFRHDKFIGTEVPRNFSSEIRLIDPRHNEDRPVLIYMNHPLRYDGATFFQQSYKPDESGTVLQVVRNPGWLLPYISCALVAAGLLLHFGVMMWKFAGKARAPRTCSGESDQSARPASLQRDRGWIVTCTVTALLTLIFLASQFRPESFGDQGFDFTAFGQIPVTAEGRVKPMDTVARNGLMVVSDRQTFSDDAQRVPAIQWLLDVMARPELADDYPVFRIDHPDVRSLVNQDTAGARDRFSFNQLIAFGEELTQQAQQASEVPSKNRNDYQRHVLELYSHLQRYAELRSLQRPFAVPPHDDVTDWQPLAQAIHLMHGNHAGHDHGDVAGLTLPSVTMLSEILSAYREQNPAAFNTIVTEYRTWLTTEHPHLLPKASLEVVFNRFAPFYQGTMLYVIAFILAALSMLLTGSRWSSRLLVAAVTLVALTFVLHTLGIGARMWLQGRPPVTNLYSSAVFIGWVAVLLALILESFFRNGLSTLLAALIGFITLIIAHNLAAGDTMEMMQAVLDSNFWLATHVITVTIGYSAVFLAGFLGIAYILGGVYTTVLTPDRAKTLYKMIYGVTAFALLFSFVGTVLGGIWADQSWGRFWGWDPKENGAVLIVLVTALMLHARWGGMIQARGMAVLAVLGNIITAWSWFGTNMLGIGLHSYGFMDAAMLWLLIFVGTQLAIMAAGLMPLRRWASFEAQAVKPRKVKPQMNTD